MVLAIFPARSDIWPRNMLTVTRMPEPLAWSLSATRVEATPSDEPSRAWSWEASEQ